MCSSKAWRTAICLQVCRRGGRECDLASPKQAVPPCRPHIQPEAQERNQTQHQSCYLTKCRVWDAGQLPPRDTKGRSRKVCLLLLSSENQPLTPGRPADQADRSRRGASENGKQGLSTQIKAAPQCYTTTPTPDGTRRAELSSRPEYDFSFTPGQSVSVPIQAWCTSRPLIKEAEAGRG